MCLLGVNSFLLDLIFEPRDSSCVLAIAFTEGGSWCFYAQDYIGGMQTCMHAEPKAYA